MPKDYEEPWSKNYHKKFSDPRIQVVSQALLAPNGHNMQPWLIKLDPKDPLTFYLYGDAERLTPQFDPWARQFVITQGTFLEYAQIAAQPLGYQLEIFPFPNGEYNAEGSKASVQEKPAAKVVLRPSAPVNHPLYDMMFLPDTYRIPFQSTPLSEDQIDQLKNINDDDHLSLVVFTDPDNLKKISAYALSAATIEAGIRSIAALNCKLFRINDAEKSKNRYGFSLESQGTSGLVLNTMQLMLSLFPSLNNEQSASDLFIKTTKTAVENTPAYILILSKDNRRPTQLSAGRLYSRLVLTAHTLGLGLQPLSQAVEEYPEVQMIYRQIHQDYAPGGQTIQMLARIGTPIQSVPQSLRRDVMELLKAQN